MTQTEFYTEVATEMCYTVNDPQFISALESACVTQAEWTADRHDCKARIRGALEELSAAEEWDWQNDFNYVGSRHHY